MARHLGIVQTNLSNLQLSKTEHTKKLNFKEKQIENASNARTNLAVGQNHEGATSLSLKHNGNEDGVGRAKLAVPSIARDANAIQALKVKKTIRNTNIFLLPLLPKHVAVL